MSLTVAKEISLGAAVAACLLELNSIFAVKKKKELRRAPEAFFFYWTTCFRFSQALAVMRLAGRVMRVTRKSDCSA